MLWNKTSVCCLSLSPTVFRSPAPTYSASCFFVVVVPCSIPEINPHFHLLRDMDGEVGGWRSQCHSFLLLPLQPHRLRVLQSILLSFRVSWCRSLPPTFIRYVSNGWLNESACKKRLSCPIQTEPVTKYNGSQQRANCCHSHISLLCGSMSMKVSIIDRFLLCSFCPLYHSLLF